MSRALRDIPAIRALAEREAREHLDAVRDARRGSVGLDPEWEIPSQAAREWWTSAHLCLLCDLSRDASATGLAGILAEHASTTGRDVDKLVQVLHPAFWLSGDGDDADTLWVASCGVAYRFALDGFAGWDDTSALALIAATVLP